MPGPSDCGVVARVVVAVVGVVLGVVVAAVFGAVYNNVHAACWGLVSGVAAAVTLYVHVTYYRQWYQEEPSPLRKLMYCGCFFQLAGVCAFIVYIVLAIKDKQGVVIYGEGYYLTSVWCFMTWKWGFLLFFFSRAYWRKIVGAFLLLLPAEDGTLAETDYGSKS